MSYTGDNGQIIRKFTEIFQNRLYMVYGKNKNKNIPALIITRG